MLRYSKFLYCRLKNGYSISNRICATILKLYRLRILFDCGGRFYHVTCLDCVSNSACRNNNHYVQENIMSILLDAPWHIPKNLNNVWMIIHLFIIMSSQLFIMYLWSSLDSLETTFKFHVITNKITANLPKIYKAFFTMIEKIE